MKIEFEKIIERANQRKETLEGLVSLLDEAPAMASMLGEVIKWVDTLSLQFGELDQEGRTVLGDELKFALEYAYSTREQLKVANRNQSFGTFPSGKSRVSGVGALAELMG